MVRVQPYVALGPKVKAYRGVVVYHCVFLRKVFRQSHIDMMSFSMQFKKIGCG